MNQARARIALIHAVTVAVEPVLEAFRRLWPEADCVNLLDDSLSPDRARDADLTGPMRGRILALARYARSVEARGILFTCSAFGEAIEEAAREAPVPVLKPNEAMFDEALSLGGRIGMLATFAPSVDGMQREFEEAAATRRRGATLQTICLPEAMSALRGGDAERHNALLAEAAPRLSGCDAILLAHFSTSRAEAAVSQAVALPVLTSPASAVRKLKAALSA